MNIFTSSHFCSNKKILIFLSVIILSNFLYAQSTLKSTLNIKNFKEFHSFTEIQIIMNEYWDTMHVEKGYILENDVETKVPGWKLSKRWEYFWEQRVNQVTGKFPATNSVIEYDKYLKTQKSLNKTTYSENWTNLGTSSSSGGYAGIGRINCIAFHPADNNTFWVGSPSGGIWKTTNGGSSWSILNDNELVLGVSDIAVPSDYATTNTLYIATGDRDGGSIWSLSGGHNADNNSIGVLKTTNGGITWSATGLNFSKSLGVRMYRLLIDPTDNSILIAATTSGIYKSTDYGNSWTQKDVNRWIDLEFKPGDHNTIYGSSYGYNPGYLAKSTNNGESWTYLSIGANGYRNEIAVSPNNPSVVYLLACNNTGGLLGVYRSTNSGTSISQVNTNTSQNMLSYYTDGSGGTSGQGNYDLCIASSPTNANVIFIGGICTWKSTDGGVTWTANNNWTSSSIYNKSGVPVVHADKHGLAFQNGTSLYECNDGGIYKSTNGGTSWSDLSNGLVISQVYRIGVSQTSSTTVLTGLQDNGSKLYNAGFWTDVKGGDGMECIVDYSNPNYMYATYVQGQISRSTNGGLSFPTNISANIPGGQPTGAWVTPYIMDPNNAANLFAGYDKVWKTTDRGNTWASASQVLSSTTKLRSLAIAASNSNYLYAADQTNMWRTTDGGATNWSTITLPTTANAVTYIAVKNNDPNTVWISYGGYADDSKVYESTDGGGTWANISTGLPNLPVMCVIQYKAATNRHVLFAGADVGVYVKDGANNWASYSNGLPNVVVTELEVLYTGGTNKLRVGTYGRGLWETDIDAGLPVELSAFTGSFKNDFVLLNWATQTEAKNYGFDIERKRQNDENDSWVKIGFVNGSGNSNSPKHYNFKDININYGTYSYRLKQIDHDGQFSHSKSIEVFTGSAPTKYALEQNYPNPFNPTTTIKYQIPKSGLVQLKLFNLLGSEVTELVNEVKSEGEYSVKLDAGNLPSGVYLYKLQAGNFVEIKKLMLLK